MPLSGLLYARRFFALDTIKQWQAVSWHWGHSSLRPLNWTRSTQWIQGVKWIPRYKVSPNHKSEYEILTRKLGTVISLYTVGAAVGALSCIQLCDFLGRRRTIFLAPAIAVLGAIIMASSFSLSQLIVARLVLGVGTGGHTACIPVWQSEISTSKIRGTHVAAEGVFVGLGIACALWLDFGFTFLIRTQFPGAFHLQCRFPCRLL